jgi:hypothetical protein
MRHLISLVAKAAHPGGMRRTSAPAALVAATSFPLIGPPGSQRAVATAVDLATIATAADDDLRPATGAHVQAARGQLHWRFLQNAKEEESNKVDGPREQCDTDRSHGCPAGRQACHVDIPCGGAAPDWTWRLRPALRLLFFFGKRLSTMRTARPDAGHVSSRPTGSLRRALHQHPGHDVLVTSASSFLLSRHAASM